MKHSVGQTPVLTHGSLVSGREDVDAVGSLIDEPLEALQIRRRLVRRDVVDGLNQPGALPGEEAQQANSSVGPELLGELLGPVQVDH
jgi:hypothetical protein